MPGRVVCPPHRFNLTQKILPTTTIAETHIFLILCCVVENNLQEGDFGAHQNRVEVFRKEYKLNEKSFQLKKKATKMKNLGVKLQSRGLKSKTLKIGPENIALQLL